MKGISKREGIMLLILGIVLIGYIYYSVFYEGIYKKIEVSKSNIEKYTQEVNEAKLNRELFSEYRNQIEDIKSKYEEAKLILPELEMNPEIVAGIQKFIQVSRVQVKSIALGEPEEMQNPVSGDGNGENAGELLVTVPVTILFTANSYGEAMNFIALFEKDKRFVQITNTTITANKIAQSTPITPPQNTGINFGSGTEIEVSLVARYFYAPNYLH